MSATITIPYRDTVATAALCLSMVGLGGALGTEALAIGMIEWLDLTLGPTADPDVVRLHRLYNWLMYGAGGLFVAGSAVFLALELDWGEAS